MSLILGQKNNIFFFEFKILKKFSNLKHAIFMRRGGYSEKPFDSLNLSLSVGDTQENVMKNRNLIFEIMGKNELVFVQQNHGSNIKILKKVNNLNNLENLENADAIITNLANNALVIQVADCQSILLYDPVLRVIANIHSGWRGSVQNIIKNSVSKMTEEFKSKPENIIACVGPSLGPCCAEFVNYKNELPEEFWIYKNNKSEKFNFNFWAITQWQLICSGILTQNIYFSGLCTSCYTNWFFSYRKEKITGRFGTAICLV